MIANSYLNNSLSKFLVRTVLRKPELLQSLMALEKLLLVKLIKSFGELLRAGWFLSHDLLGKAVRGTVRAG